MSGLLNATLVGLTGTVATLALLLVLRPESELAWIVTAITAVVLAAVVFASRQVRTHHTHESSARKRTTWH